MREEEQHQSVSIHMGFPNPAADKDVSTLDLHQLLVTRPASTFLFRIAGDQWQEMGIFNNDIAVIDRSLSPRKTDIIVWWHENTGQFQLSVHSAMPPDAALWGVVTSTVHQFRP